MPLYKFLDSCIKLNNLENIILLILKNYSLFDKIKILNNNFNKSLFDVKIYNKTKDDENLMLMFRILEAKFYDKISNVAIRDIKYNYEINNDSSDNRYLVFATNTTLHFDI